MAQQAPFTNMSMSIYVIISNLAADNSDIMRLIDIILMYQHS